MVDFSINPDDDSGYYVLNGNRFEKGEHAVFNEMVHGLDSNVVHKFLVQNWPTEYGKAVLLMLDEGYLPDGMTEDEKSEIEKLQMESIFLPADELGELWGALGKYTLCCEAQGSGPCYSYFGDVFESGSSEVDAMLEEVAQFVTQQQSAQ